jgi:AcrR family transcriptional regulator
MKEAVSDQLSMSTMSLHRHVPGKTELFDLMVDRVSAEAHYDDAPEDWRSRLEQVARVNRALFERRPWLTTLLPRQPPLGPGVIAKYDAEWRATLAPHLDRVPDQERYPLAVRVGTAATSHYNGVHDAEHAFEFGLQRVLDGIETSCGRSSHQPIGMKHSVLIL